jgi:hypothetical protein
VNTDLSYLYYGNTNLTGTYMLSQIITEDVTDLRYAFAYCTGITSILSYTQETGIIPTVNVDSTGYISIDGELSNTYTYTSGKNNITYSYDNYIERLTYSYNGKFIDSNIEYSYKYNYDEVLTYNTYTYNFNSFNGNKIKNLNHTFYNCYNLTEVDLTYINLNECIDAQFMFGNCYNLHTVKFGRCIPNANLNADNIFYGCENLTYVYIPFEYMNEYKNIYGQCGKATFLYDYKYTDFYNIPDIHTMSYISDLTETNRYITFTLTGIDTLLIETWQYHDSNRRKTIHNIFDTNFPDYDIYGENHTMTILLNISNEHIVELYNFDFTGKFNKDIIKENVLTEPKSYTYKLEKDSDGNYIYDIKLCYKIDDIFIVEHTLDNIDKLLFFDKNYKLLYFYTDGSNESEYITFTSHQYNEPTCLIDDTITIESVNSETYEIETAEMSGFYCYTDEQTGQLTNFGELTIEMGKQTPIIDDEHNRVSYLYAD